MYQFRNRLINSMLFIHFHNPTLCVCRFESRWSKEKQCVSTNYNFNTIGLNVQTSDIYLNNIFKHIFIDELHITFFFTIQYNIGFRNKRNAYKNHETQIHHVIFYLECSLQFPSFFFFFL
jgi:hypothetical protein